VSREFKHLVRLHGVTLDGSKTTPHAICGIKGIGVNLAYAIVKKANLDSDTRLGNLSDAEIKRLEDTIENITERGLPNWMFNRRKDPQTGKDLHLLGSDLTLKWREDIEFMKEIRSWKGLRHSYGLKVRGQRTKTAARKGRSIGVSKKQERKQSTQQA